jgi:hypothetical protein
MKTFTIDEANALVPQLEELLGDMIEMRDNLAMKGQMLQPMLDHAGGNGGSKAGSEYALLLQRFQASLNLFQDLGVELKDLDQGLIDFPSYRDGKLVYLCWQRGETRIDFWHDIDTGFASRQPL